MVNEVLLTQSTLGSHSGVNNAEVTHKSKRSTYALAIMNGDTVHGGIVHNRGTIGLYDTESAFNSEKMMNQRLGDA
jgi:hypothetical protein